MTTENIMQRKKKLSAKLSRWKADTTELDDYRFSEEMNDVTVQVVSNVNDVTPLSEEWDELVSDSSGTIFQTYDWQYLWWKHFSPGAGCRLLVVLLKERDRLIGLAPFFLQTYSTMGVTTFRHLKLIGSGLRTEKTKVLSLEREGPADYLDVIARRGHEDVVGRYVANFVKAHRGQWDEIEFQNLPEDGIVMKHVLPHFENASLEVAIEPSDVCPKIALAATLEDYLSEVDHRTRRSLRRSQRTYLDSMDFSIEEPNGDERIRSSMHELIQLHQKHWNSSGYPGLFADKRFESMQVDLAETLGRKNRLWFSILRHEGRPIAARLCFVFNGCVSDYLSGIESKRAESGTAAYSGAGIALLMCAIRWAIKSGYSTLDLLRGDESYKKGLASSAPRNYRIAVRRAGRRRDLRYAGYRFASAGFSLSSRLACEWGIFRIVAGNAGPLRALPVYAAHLMKRIKRPRRTPFGSLNRTPEQDGPLTARLVSSSAPESVGNRITNARGSSTLQTEVADSKTNKVHESMVLNKKDKEKA